MSIFLHLYPTIFIFGFSIVLSIKEGRKWIEKKLYSLPLVGKLTKYYYLIRFLRYTKLLISSGMNYVDVFKLLSRIMSSLYYKDMIQDISESIRKGENISDVIRLYKMIIPPEVIALIKVGEETASLTDALDNAVWLYDEEFNKLLDNLSRVIEPILIVFVGGLVGFVAVSVFGIVGTILESLQF